MVSETMPRDICLYFDGLDKFIWFIKIIEAARLARGWIGEKNIFQRRFYQFRKILFKRKKKDAVV